MEKFGRKRFPFPFSSLLNKQDALFLLTLPLPSLLLSLPFFSLIICYPNITFIVHMSWKLLNQHKSSSYAYNQQITKNTTKICSFLINQLNNYYLICPAIVRGTIISNLTKQTKIKIRTITNKIKETMNQNQKFIYPKKQ